MTRQFKSMAEMRRFEHSQREREKSRKQRRTAQCDWSDDEIRGEFDCNPNMSVAQLAIITGKTVSEIKKILLKE